MPTSEFIFEANEANFQAAVVERSFEKPVVVDFWAEWCEPCKALAPILERLVQARNGDVLLAKVNVDENPRLAEYFQISSIPAVKAIKDGALILQFEGALPEESLNEFLDRLAPNEIEKQAAKAKSLEASKPAEAEAIYRQILEKDKDHVAARLGLARLRLAAGALDEIDALLEPIPPGGENGAEADRIRSERDLRRQSASAGNEPDLRRKIEADPENANLRFELGAALAAQKRYPEALAMLVSAAELDRDLARGKVKDLMVQIFHIIGMRSDLADEYRTKLQRVMY
ncbi:MAG TPA: tetratricopeptide repeat protein [Gemmataceae bacterium]|jgi:putative thioredoxin|nr:tetratricopeptide repeat protein [Gemmataceae bacterium]